MRTDVVAVAAELNRREALKQQLIEMCPDILDDDQALMDTIDGESNLDEILVSLARATKERDAAAKSCKELAKVYTERAKRHEAAKEAIRKTIIWAMTAAGKKSLKHALASLSVTDLENKIEIVDREPEMADEKFVKRRTVVEYDLEKINANIEEAVDAGIIVIHYDRKSVNIRV